MNKIKILLWIGLAIGALSAVTVLADDPIPTCPPECPRPKPKPKKCPFWYSCGG